VVGFLWLWLWLWILDVLQSILSSASSAAAAACGGSGGFWILVWILDQWRRKWKMAGRIHTGTTASTAEACM